MPTIKINKQEAKENIYNISSEDVTLGDVGEINLFLDSEAAKKLYEEDIQKKLKLQCDINYFSALESSVTDKNVLQREHIVDELLKLTAEHNQVLMSGPPGSGKSTILYLLSKKLSNFQYYSIKEKPPKVVLEYLVNKLRIESDLDTLEVNDETTGLQILESELQNSETVFIVDDIDGNIDFAKKLLNIEKFKNKFIFSSRTENVALQIPCPKYELPPLDEEEIKSYLQLYGIDVGEVNFIELKNASRGNPLYLYYFAVFQIDPLPTDLESFQEALWHNIGVEEQSCVAFVALSMFSIETEILLKAFNKEHEKNVPPIEFVKFLKSISLLAKDDEGSYTIFHLYFKEYIVNALSSDGIEKHYKRTLGEIYLENEYYVDATFLLLDLEFKKIEEYIFAILPYLDSVGQWDLAIRMLEKKLKSKNEPLDRGFIFYYLSDINRKIGAIEKSYYYIDKSIRVFQRNKLRPWTFAAKTMKATYLFEDMQIDDGERLLKALEKGKKAFSDKHILAGYYLNLSKIYVDIEIYDKGAKNAKKAYELFDDLKDINGLKLSFGNYVSCLSQLEEFELAEDYSKKILEIADDSDKRLKTLALNNLTSINRRNGKYDDAKKYCREAIDICNELKLKEKVLLNLLNLGNIYRDDNDPDEAEKIYKEGLLLATEINRLRDISRSHCLLAKLYNGKGEDKKAEKCAIRALKISPVNYYVGLAQANKELAKSKKSLGHNESAAGLYEEAAKYYAYFDNDEASSCLIKAFNLWNEQSSTIEAINSLNMFFINDNSIDSYSYLFNSADEIKNRDILNFINSKFVDILKNYISDYKEERIRFFVNFITFCRRNISVGGALFYDNVLSQLTNSITKKTNALTLLAFAIEQSQELLSELKLKELIEDIVTQVEDWYYRTTSDGMHVVTFCLSDAIIQIHIFSDKILKLFIAISLLLKAKQDVLISRIKKLKSPHCIINALAYDEMPEDLRSFFQNETIPKEHPAIFTKKTDLSDSEAPTIAVINDNYEIYSDYLTNEGNQCFFWVSMNSFFRIIENLGHLDIEVIDSSREELLNTLAPIFGFKKSNIDKLTTSEWSIDINTLKNPKFFTQ